MRIFGYDFNIDKKNNPPEKYSHERLANELGLSVKEIDRVVNLMKNDQSACAIFAARPQTDESPMAVIARLICAERL